MKYSVLVIACLVAASTASAGDGLAALLDATRIELPDERILDLSIFEPVAADDKGEKAKEFVLRLPYPDTKKPFATLRLNGEGKLHGACSAQHENGSPMLAGRYEGGDREGPFRWLAVDGKKLLDAQFKNGKEHGFVCFYRDGKPALVQECKVGQPRWSHRIENNKVVETLDHVKEKVEAASPELRKLLEAHTEFARTLRQNEREIKNLVQDFVDEGRKRNAAARGPVLARMMQERVNAGAALDAALINTLRGKAGF